MDRLPKRLAVIAALAVAVATTGCAAWRISTSAELARLSQPYQQRPERPALRLLIVGDSTGVGTGASSGATSVAGLLGQGHPGLWIDNRAQDGARVADLPVQLAQADASFDIVLIMAGGNDVIRLSPWPPLREAIHNVTVLARQKAPLVLWMPAGNVGNAPFFFAPMSWWMTQRSRELHRLVAEAAMRHGAVYVNLFKEQADDPFAHDRSLHARDGLHPSDSGYRLWWQTLMLQGRLAQPLAAAAAPV